MVRSATFHQPQEVVSTLGRRLSTSAQRWDNLLRLPVCFSSLIAWRLGGGARIQAYPSLVLFISWQNVLILFAHPLLATPAGSLTRYYGKVSGTPPCDLWPHRSVSPVLSCPTLPSILNESGSQLNDPQCRLGSQPVDKDSAYLSSMNWSEYKCTRNLYDQSWGNVD